eukprot:TRINITY_DN16308_c0_g2_i1.p1 TRINITY_DN16308_c0_g2~~TRINITY_DN16308_c0_g2_i1.p1  ORF type:complete len:283 (+),score=-26.71 TRINITY_DN16308_c0_g2_i1:317-1165(+)
MDQSVASAGRTISFHPGLEFPTLGHQRKQISAAPRPLTPPSPSSPLDLPGRAGTIQNDDRESPAQACPPHAHSPFALPASPLEDADSSPAGLQASLDLLQRRAARVNAAARQRLARISARMRALDAVKRDVDEALAAIATIRQKRQAAGQPEERQRTTRQRRGLDGDGFQRSARSDVEREEGERLDEETNRGGCSQRLSSESSSDSTGSVSGPSSSDDDDGADDVAYLERTPPVNTSVAPASAHTERCGRASARAWSCGREVRNVTMPPHGAHIVRGIRAER